MARSRPLALRVRKARKQRCDEDEMTAGRKFWARKVVLLLIIGGAAVATIGIGAFRFARAVPRIPIATVQRGTFVNYVAVRGETKAGRSVTLEAPPQPDNLQILKIAPNGKQVKPGDEVVEFDTTALKQTLAQDESALKSAEAEIEQSRAQSRIKEEQDLTDVMKARFDVQSAQLDASKSTIESKIDGQEAELVVADAQQKLKELETKLKSDQESDAADLKSKQQKSEQAIFQVHQAQEGLKLLVLKAPSAGVVTIDLNRSSGGPFGNGAPFKPGDRVWAGAALAELPDLSTLYISTRVDEAERGNLKPGQKASIRVDGIPDREFKATVSRISDMASVDFSAPYPFPKNFTMTLALQARDPRLRPGMTANIRVASEEVADAILIPSEAVFQKGGSSVVYLARGSKFEARPIEVAGRSGGQVLVTKGLQVGERVTLKDPTLQE
ncbi:MAG TPA: efflux RND transporter periplasmic adaptor subunit [Candidatus Acidoferrales bacterium]|nr:efflux RND transporter periplasmic adaptor subunit [Candidatus Acidoferrales bacterium]